jgi:uncharacterized membrane protein YqjE
MAASDEAPASTAGFMDSVRGLGDSLLSLIRTRAELLAIELEEEKERRKEMLILAVLGALFLALGLQLLAFLLVVALWDTYRLPAIIGVTCLYLGVAAWAMFRLRFKWRDSPAPFAATLEELGKDMDALQERHE